MFVTLNYDQPTTPFYSYNKPVEMFLYLYVDLFTTIPKITPQKLPTTPRTVLVKLL